VLRRTISSMWWFLAGNVLQNLSSVAAFIFKLGDKAGVNKIYVQDEDGNIVGSIDSTGIVQWSGWANCGSSFFAQGIAASSLGPRSAFYDMPLVLQTQNQSWIFRNVDTGDEEAKKIRRVQTNDATPVDLTTITVEEGEHYYVRAVILGKKTDHNDRSLCVIEGAFYRESGGDVTLLGDKRIWADRSDLTWGVPNLVAAPASQTIDLRIIGKEATDIDWVGGVEILKIAG